MKKDNSKTNIQGSENLFTRGGIDYENPRTMKKLVKFLLIEYNNWNKIKE